MSWFNFFRTTRWGRGFTTFGVLGGINLKYQIRSFLVFSCIFTLFKTWYFFTVSYGQILAQFHCLLHVLSWRNGTYFLCSKMISQIYHTLHFYSLSMFGIRHTGSGRSNRALWLLCLLSANGQYKKFPPCNSVRGIFFMETCSSSFKRMSIYS